MVPFLGFMRILSLLLIALCMPNQRGDAADAPTAALPPELAGALDALQTDSPRGWGFTQTTEAEERSRVERYEPLGPRPARWTLLQVDGRPPTPAELEEYRKHQTLRAGLEQAPNVKQQIDRASAEKLSDDGVRAVWQFELDPGSPGDNWADHMRASFTLHRPTRTIECVELASPEPFSPMFLTTVQEARTIMRYSLPEDGRPALLQEVTVRVRGRAWLFRSLDSDLTVRYTDYRYVGRPSTREVTR